MTATGNTQAACYHPDDDEAGQPEAPAIPGVARWRRKTVEVEAIQWTGENLEAIRKLTGNGRYMTGEDGTLRVLVSSGWRRVDTGWWAGRENRELFVDTERGFAYNYEPAPGPDWKDRAEAAEAKLAEVREVISTYFAVHGNSTAAALQSARDLAEGTRQVLDREPLGGTQDRSDEKESP